MNTPVRVIVYEPYPMGLGGNFVTQRLILERLVESKFTPIVMSPVDGVALDEYRRMGVECVVLSPSGTLGQYGGAVLKEGILGRLKSVFNLMLYNFRIARFLRMKKIDLVYTNCVRAQLSVGIAAWFTRIPSILYIKGELANPILDRLCFILASRILFFCEYNRDDQYPQVVKWYRKKIDILRPGLDPAVISKVERSNDKEFMQELDINCDCVNAAVLAQLYRPKGQHFVIEALARLVEEFPQAHLYILGDHVIDEYRQYKLELEELIERYGLTDHVHFMGWREDALNIAKNMDIVLHPSLSEGFGRAVLESMALGKPVIASAVGGLREAIRDGINGFLVEPGDIDSITQRWRELLSSPELRQRLGQEARRTVFADYLIDDKVERLSEIWLDMAAGNS